MNRRDALVMFAGGMFVSGTDGTGASGQDSDRDRTDWVGQVLRRIQTVKTDMTREELLGVFTTEGGLSTPLQQTFVSRDCRYFKVDVTFRAFGRADQDIEGRVTDAENPRDQIVTISRPYLEFSVTD